MRHSKEASAKIIPTCSLALGIAACSSGKLGSEHTPASAHKFTITLTPNMSDFLKPSSSTTCYNGGARPCAILIRTSPELSSDFINANPTQQRVNWPIEAYNGQPGDGVEVLCYDRNGELIRPYEGVTSSTDWYEVTVPEQHVLNPAVQTELHKSNSPIHTIKQNDRLGVLGWTSVEWFGGSTALSRVPEC